MPAATMSRDERAGRVLDVAERLFYARGIRGVGMDELVRETGLSKMSVYRLFPTKDALVGAYLARRRQRILGLIDADLERHADNPRAAIEAIVDASALELSRPGFRGCPFNNAGAEFEDPEHPARQEAGRYKRALLERLTIPAQGLLGAKAGDALAAQVALIIDGMYLSAGLLGPQGPAAQGQGMVRELLDRAEAR